jgi:hypothetical protein
VKRVLAAALFAGLSVMPFAALAGDGPIQDNSFLLEEAYNQEPGVIQHISFFQRDRASGDWVYAYTEEWPALGQDHQLSVTLPVQRSNSLAERKVGMGDVALNYRWQAIGNGEEAVAVSPRLSVLLPTGDWKRGFGSGKPGAQVNLPISSMLGKYFVTHTNVGTTWIPSARTVAGTGDSIAMNLGQSLIWLVHSNVNLMFEAAYTFGELALPAGTQTQQSLFLSPGVRGAIDLPVWLGVQVVPGFAVPIGVGPSSGERGMIAYLSFEHAITRNPW